MPRVLKPNQILTVAFFLLLSLPVLAVDYYWIGGSGNWGDLTHWATASGNGTVLHNKTPGSGDDVYIDANSLNGVTDTIVMNVQTAFCRSISIKNIGGNLTFIFTSGKFLRVFGNIDINDFQIIGGGTISCESPVTGRTIATHYKYIPNLEFNSVVGGWALLDSLNAGSITKNSGSLKSNENYIQCNGFTVYAGATNLDTAQIFCSYFNINGGGFSFKLGRLDVSSNANISNVSSISTDGTSVYHTGSYFFDYATAAHRFDSIFFLNLNVQFPHLNAGVSMTAKHVQFYHDGELSGQWHADSLVLKPSKVYLIGAYSNIKFDKVLAQGDCMNWINIECATRTGIGSFTVNSANTSAYIRFRNITATGSSWNVTPHVNIGTVTGITGTAYQGKKMYWVGGSGRWNNPAHWSLTDGGIPMNCIPGPLDSLYFTDNSGTTTTNVNFGDSIVQFHSLFAINQNLAINFTGVNKPMQAMGSFVLSSSANWNVSKNIALYGADTTYVIESNGNTFSFISVLGGGKWIIVDTLNAGTLSIVNGKVKAKSRVMNLSSLIDDYNEWTSGFKPSDLAILVIDSALVNIATQVRLSQGDFTLFADYSRVNCSTNVYFYTINPLLQWNIVEWISNLGVARLKGNPKRIRQLILNSETEDETDLLMDTLTIVKGNTYKFANSIKFQHINALGECNKRIIIRPWSTITNWDGLNQINDVYYSLFENVAFSNGTLSAYNSFDLAGNSGINFIQGLSRTLYWVGGTGEWDDSTHWSLSSGGLGGECIPTPADSVVFDNNSAQGNMTASIATTAFARDLMMFNSSFELTLTSSPNMTPSSHIEIYGNVWLSEELNYTYYREMILKPDSGSFIFKTNNSSAYWLEHEGAGNYLLIDTLKLDRFFRYDGIFDCDANHVDVAYMYNYGGDLINSNATMEFLYLYSGSNIEFPHCDVVVNQEANISGQVYSHEAKLLFTSTYPVFTTSAVDTITKVIFINPSGKAQVNIISSHVTYIQFNGWAYLNRSTSVDTCIMTNGNSYFFNPSYNHRVYKYWDVDGDFCNPILLRSQTQGVKAPVFSNDTVSGDFLEIRDLNFLGTSVFYTGEHSVDQGNNSGFIWTNRPGYIWGLGPDRYYLECNPFNPSGTLLTTENFQDAASYLWSDNSTGDSLLVTTSGVYWCTADYITCQVTDTIEVIFSTVIIDVEDSTVFCSPRTLNLTLVDSTIENRYTYLWNTGATTNSITFNFYADTTLIFWIYDSLGTVCNDTIHLYLLIYDYSPKELNVLNCAAGDLESLVYQYLKIAPPDSSVFDWSAFDSITNTYYDVLRFTLYYDGCEILDSINLRYDYPFPIIPSDSLLCEGSTVTFRVTNPIPTFDYLWSTGETTLTIKRQITTEGQVYVTVTDDLGRTCSDTVNYKMGNPVQASARPKFVQGIQPFQAQFVGSKIQADASYWIYNGDTISLSDTLNYQFINKGTYEVYYYAVNTNTGCFDIDTVIVEVTENAVAWIPSAFSPNADGTNDVWDFIIGDHIQGPIHVQVFNRWGNIVYETYNRHVQWDGYLNGKPVQMDAYVYVLSYGSAVTPRVIYGSVVVVQ